MAQQSVIRGRRKNFWQDPETGMWYSYDKAEAESDSRTNPAISEEARYNLRRGRGMEKFAVSDQPGGQTVVYKGPRSIAPASDHARETAMMRGAVPAGTSNTNLNTVTIPKRTMPAAGYSARQRTGPSQAMVDPGMAAARPMRVRRRYGESGLPSFTVYVGENAARQRAAQLNAANLGPQVRAEQKAASEAALASARDAFGIGPASEREWEAQKLEIGMLERRNAADLAYQRQQETMLARQDFEVEQAKTKRDQELADMAAKREWTQSDDELAAQNATALQNMREEGMLDRLTATDVFRNERTQRTLMGRGYTFSPEDTRAMQMLKQQIQNIQKDEKLDPQTKRSQVLAKQRELSTYMPERHQVPRPNLDEEGGDVTWYTDPDTGKKLPVVYDRNREPQVMPGWKQPSEDRISPPEIMEMRIKARESLVTQVMGKDGKKVDKLPTEDEINEEVMKSIRAAIDVQRKLQQERSARQQEQPSAEGAAPAQPAASPSEQPFGPSMSTSGLTLDQILQHDSRMMGQPTASLGEQSTQQSEHVLTPNQEAIKRRLLERHNGF